MLVTFTCEAYSNITMFGDVGLRLIKMMGHSGTVPGAILAKDVPAALAKLKEGIDREKNPQALQSNGDSDPPVSLAHRALPLIELLAAAQKENCNVMWK